MSRSARHHAWIIIAALPLAACSSAPDSTSGAGGGTGTGNGGGGHDSGLPPPPAGEGVQFEMDTRVGAGIEDERCKFVTATEDLWVHQEEVRYTPASHHFILWSTTYTSIPTKDINGNTVDTSDVFECPGGPPAAWSVNRYVGGSQSADAPSVLGDLPENYAMHIPKGAVLMMDLHIINATKETLPVTVQINLDTIDRAKVTEEAGIFFFYDPFIAVPPNGTSRARMSCPVTSDVTLTTMQTHMHKWGLGGSATLDEGSGAPLEKLYTSDTWSDPLVKQWSNPPMRLKPGQRIDYQCNYENAGAKTVIQGLSAVTNEMCVLAGAYYPRDEKFETCGTTGKFGDQDSAATYIGSGKATCGATLSCLQASQGAKDAGPFYTCMVDSCPAAADPLTKFIDCLFSAPSGSDVTQVCASEIDACLSSTCTP